MGNPVLTSIFFWSCVCVLAVTNVKACPTRCSCAGTEVDCSDQDLREIPNDIPTETTHLYLDNNLLVSISNYSFSTLENLRVLNLSTNKIEELELLAFAGLSNLKTLALVSNELTAVPANVFMGLNKLQLLSLNDNKISCLQKRSFLGLLSLQVLHLNSNKVKFLPEGIFFSTRNLKQMYLFDNSVEMLSNDVFNPLENLEDLYLYDNLITTLPRGVFDGLINIENLFLYNNPWSCDCRLTNIRQWFDENEAAINLGSSPMLCEAPEQHQGEEILSIPYANLTCHPPPVMDEPYRVTTALAGTHVTLDCNVTGTPTPTNYWITPNRTIAHRKENKRNYCHQIMPLQIEDGSLIFIDVQLEDEGPYTCIAKNIEGTTQGTTILKVAINPTTPISVNVTSDIGFPPFTRPGSPVVTVAPTELDDVISDETSIALFICVAFVGGTFAAAVCFGVVMLTRYLYNKRRAPKTETRPKPKVSKHYEECVEFENGACKVVPHPAFTEDTRHDHIYCDPKIPDIEDPRYVSTVPDKVKPVINEAFDED